MMKLEDKESNVSSTYLMKIKSTVGKYASIIANVLHVNVEVVDKYLNRIAGTGIYENGIGKNIESEGNIYKHVLETGKTQVIEEPGKHVLCKGCINENNCLEHMEIATPIYYKESIIGVIGLVCFSKEQKKYILTHFDNLVQFLIQIADFISTKVYEVKEKDLNIGRTQLFEELLDRTKEGILIVDSDNKIKYLNSYGKYMLKLKADYKNEALFINGTETIDEYSSIFKIKIKDRRYIVMGKFLTISSLIKNYDRVLLFKIHKDVKEVNEVNNKWGFVKLDNIIGKSESILNIKFKIKKIATFNSTVLINGESGTGKELIARAIHSESSRWDKPFIAINCGAIPENLLESELFGYVKGAFTGASVTGKVGKFELANGGVIFLDEIGDMPLSLQVKILRVLQERKFARIGSNKLIDLDIRVVTATNKDLKKMIKENLFREDLYYRLNVIPLEIPPLRDRDSDIELILMYFIEKFNREFNKNVHTIDKEALDEINSYPWPGNIRELENVVEYMMNLVGDKGIITKGILPESMINYNSKCKIKEKNTNIDLNENIKSLKEIEIEYITKVLDKYGYDVIGKKKAAKKLGIGLATLYRKIGELK